MRFFEGGSDRFMATIEASEALKARARVIRDELTDLLANAIAATKKRRHSDPTASLAAALLVATWTVALTESHRAFQRDHNVAKANKAFLALVDRGARGVQAALEGTPYQ